MSAPSKIIVAIHGIGDQTAFEAVQAVIKQFCICYQQPATVSLGRLDSAIRSEKGALVLTPPVDPHLPLNASFTEVHWGDIAREIESKGYRLEDPRHWARTIVERLKLNHQNGRLFNPDDFELLKHVLQEAINAIFISELSMTVFKHAGAYKPKVERALTHYLGDVQLVSEFQVVREQILAQFNKAMELVHNSAPGAEIHIIAHSEGTVISFLGLLKNLKLGASAPAWVRKVKGLVTLGSPIDKHLVLWREELWKEFEEAPVSWADCQIRWNNYYDLGDPVGFKLDTAREWLDKVKCKCFDFTDENDFGYARSYLPGKAHVDYWTDTELFRHIIATVIAPPRAQDSSSAADPSQKAKARTPLPDRPLARCTSVLPYFGSFLTLLIGVYLLYKSLGFEETAKALTLNSLFITLLLAGITALSRVVRLSRRGFDHFCATLFFALTTTSFILFTTPGAKSNIADGIRILLPVQNGDLAIAVMSSIIAAIGLLSRKYSLKPLLLTGSVVVGVVIGQILLSENLYVTRLGPVVTMSIAFFCLWWLAAIIFDLTFIWRSYVRTNRVGSKLREAYDLRESPQEPVLNEQPAL